MRRSKASDSLAKRKRYEKEVALRKLTGKQLLVRCQEAAGFLFPTGPSTKPSCKTSPRNFPAKLPRSPSKPPYRPSDEDHDSVLASAPCSGTALASEPRSPLHWSPDGSFSSMQCVFGAGKAHRVHILYSEEKARCRCLRAFQVEDVNSMTGARMEQEPPRPGGPRSRTPTGLKRERQGRIG